MAVAIRGIGELDGDERRALGSIELRPVGEQFRDELRADEAREEVVHDQPLVMPAQHAARFVEHVALGCCVIAHAVDDQVVGLDERDLHLAHEDVDVVARVADEREPLAVARHVAVVLEQLGRVVPVDRYGEPTGPPP